MNISLDTFICLDIETTGLDPGVDRIIEIGAVKFQNGEKTAAFSELINPGVPIPSDIIELTGITDKMIKSSPDIESVIAEFESFLGDFVGKRGGDFNYFTPLRLTFFGFKSRRTERYHVSFRLAK